MVRGESGWVVVVGGGRLGRGSGVGGGEFPSVPCSDHPLKTRGHPFNGEPRRLSCPRKQPARKSRGGLPSSVLLFGPGSLRVDRRHGAVGGWRLALCRRALGATWSRGVVAGSLAVSSVVCLPVRSSFFYSVHPAFCACQTIPSLNVWHYPRWCPCQRG